MERPSPSNAPQELIDEIIDYCSGNKRTLIACSLTCRAWVYRTRRHLFSQLTLTDKSLPVWCGTVVTPTTGGPNPQPLPNSYPPPSSSYASSWLSSYITSLQLVPKYDPVTQNGLGARELLQAKTHLSAFTNLESLTLTAISFAAFDDDSLKACFGSLSETVRNLKLSTCHIYEKNFSSFLRMFARLESLEIEANAWYRTPMGSIASTVGTDPITLRGSFVLSGLGDGGNGVFDFLMTQKMEYETITLGYNASSAHSKLNGLIVKCKGLKTLSLTPKFLYSAGSTAALGLSPCQNLFEIRAQFIHPTFGQVTPTLSTIESPRFRKLSILLSPPTRGAEWERLDKEVFALVKRVNRAAVTNKLEVVFSYYSTSLGEIGLSEIEEGMPRAASDARVSLRVEKLPPPLGY